MIFLSFAYHFHARSRLFRVALMFPSLMKRSLVNKIKSFSRQLRRQNAKTKKKSQTSELPCTRLKRSQTIYFHSRKMGPLYEIELNLGLFAFFSFSSGRSHFGTVKKRRPTAKKKKVFHFFRLLSPFEWPHTISSLRIWLRVVSPRKRSVDERNK